MESTLRKRMEAQYEILEKLGEGGMGAIYKVRHRLLEEDRIVKVIRPELARNESYRGRFHREAKLAVRLRHPNIAQLHDFSMDDSGAAYMVIEFIEGVTFLEMLFGHGPCSVDLTIELARQTLEALRSLHSVDLAHRDISPDNIMLSTNHRGDPVVKLIDLGLAKDILDLANRTKEKTFMGKARYSAPERFSPRSKGEQETRADVYSAGLVFYELLTGQPAIQGESFEELAAGHLFKGPRDFNETDPDARVPDELRRLIMSSLERDHKQRVTTEQFLDQLQPLIHQNASHSAEVQKILSECAKDRKPGERATTSAKARIDKQFGGYQADGTPAPSPEPTAINVSLLLDKARELIARGAVELAGNVLDEARQIDPAHPRLSELDGDLAAQRSTQRDDQIRRALAAVERQIETGRLDDALDALEDAADRFGESPAFSPVKSRLRDAIDRNNANAAQKGRETEAEEQRKAEAALEQRKAEEDQRRRTEVEEKRKAEAALEQRKAEEDRRRRAEVEEKRKAEAALAQRKAEEDQRRRAEAEEKRKADAAHKRRKAEADERRKAQVARERREAKAARERKRQVRRTKASSTSPALRWGLVSGAVVAVLIGLFAWSPWQEPVQDQPITPIQEPTQDAGGQVNGTTSESTPDSEVILEPAEPVVDTSDGDDRPQLPEETIPQPDPEDLTDTQDPPDASRELSQIEEHLRAGRLARAYQAIDAARLTYGPRSEFDDLENRTNTLRASAIARDAGTVRELIRSGALDDARDAIRSMEETFGGDTPEISDLRELQAEARFDADLSAIRGLLEQGRVVDAEAAIDSAARAHGNRVQLEEHREQVVELRALSALIEDGNFREAESRLLEYKDVFGQIPPIYDLPDVTRKLVASIIDEWAAALEASDLTRLHKVFPSYAGDIPKYRAVTAGPLEIVLDRDTARVETDAIFEGRWGTSEPMPFVFHLQRSADGWQIDRTEK